MDKLRYFTRWRTGFVVFLIILGFSAVSILSINQYRYGIKSDQRITIPCLKQLLNNNLYPNDYLITQRPVDYTPLWPALVQFIKYSGVDIPKTFFFSYCISIYLTFLAFYLIAMILFGRKEVAILSLFFLLFSAAGWSPGAVGTLEDALLPRTVALPILLFSIYFFLKERYVISFFLQGVGFFVHPLSAFYVATLILISSIINLRHMGLKRFMLCITIFIVVIIPSFIWKMLRHREFPNPFYAGPEWIELLRLRLAHNIFPFTWSIYTYLTLGLLICVFFISWKHRPKPYHHRFVVCSTIVIFALWIIGTIFTEFIPLSIVMQTQLFRSSRFFSYFAMIYFANYFFAETRFEKNTFNKLAVAFISIGVLYLYGTEGWKYTYLSFIVFALLLIFYHLACRRDILPRYFVSALLVIVLILGVRGYLAKDRRFSIYNAQEKSWLDAQLWAKKNTDLADTFIVPPMLWRLSGFRTESERTIYGDFRDGSYTLMSPVFGHEWFRRMKALGYKKGQPFEEGFKNLDETDFINIANELKNNSHKTFLIMFKENDTLNFPIIYRNERFIVYEITK